MALISFDLDGVLQRNPFYMRRPEGVFGHISRELAPHTGEPDPDAAAQAGLRLVLEEHLARMEADQLVEAHDWDDIVSVVARRLGYPSVMNIADLVTRYSEHPGLVYAYPAAAECLEALRAEGHTLVSISNGFRSYQEPVQRKIGLYSYFKAYITPDSAGAAKPRPAIFRVAETYGPGPYIHVGDVLPHDIAGAKRAGWKAIYIVQAGVPHATELPAQVAALAPHQRPAAAMEWLAARLARDQHWHAHPPADLSECIPDAIVQHLSEVPAAIAGLL